MASTEFEIEILEDGQIRITTGDMHGVHHAWADEFLKTIIELSGGPVQTVKRKPTIGHLHSHGGHTHSH